MAETDDDDMEPAIVLSVGWPSKRGSDAWVLAQSLSLTTAYARFAQRLRVIRKCFLFKVTECPHCGHPFEIDPVAEAKKQVKKRKGKQDEREANPQTDSGVVDGSTRGAG
jgi:hypothetical protein